MTAPTRWSDEWIDALVDEVCRDAGGTIRDFEHELARRVAREAFEEAANQRKKIPPAHTYASENADVYRAYDAGADKMESLIRARAKEVAGG